MAANTLHMNPATKMNGTTILKWRFFPESKWPTISMIYAMMRNPMGKWTISGWKRPRN